MLDKGKDYKDKRHYGQVSFSSVGHSQKTSFTPLRVALTKSLYYFLHMYIHIHKHIHTCTPTYTHTYTYTYPHWHT